MRTLSGKQMDVVKELGSGVLFDLGMGRIVKPLCSWLLERFDTDSKTLEIDGMNILITATSFEKVIRIKDGARPIETCERSVDIVKIKVLFNRDARGVLYSRIEYLVVENRDGGVTF